MSDRTVLSGGKPVAVEGPELKPGEKAPDFRLQRSDGGEIRDVTLADQRIAVAQPIGKDHGLTVFLERFGQIAPGRVHGHREESELHTVSCAFVPLSRR